jgi:hypothetical protein
LSAAETWATWAAFFFLLAFCVGDHPAMMRAAHVSEPREEQTREHKQH